MQGVALLNFTAVIVLASVIAVALLRTFALAIKEAGLLLAVFPLVAAGMIAAGILAWRWRKTGALPIRWLVLAVPAVAFLAIYGYPLSRDLVHPSQFQNFLPSAIAIVSAAGAAVAALIAAWESRSGTTRIRGRDLAGRRGKLEVAAAAVAVLVVFSGIFFAVEAAQRTGGGNPGGGPGQAGQSVPPPGGPDAAGHTRAQLAQGVIPQLPDGTLYASVAVDKLSAGASTDVKPGAGMLFVASGTVSVGNQTVSAGQAEFLGSGTVPTHLGNAGSSDATWYFISVHPTSEKASASHEVCQSANLPSLPIVNQAETLFEGTLAKGGRSEATKTGGVEVVVGVDGTVEVHAGTLSAPKQLSGGQCVTLLEGTPVQVHSAASSESHYLAFYLAPSGVQVSSPVQQGL
jgi:hypothetical protein